MGCGASKKGADVKHCDPLKPVARSDAGWTAVLATGLPGAPPDAAAAAPWTPIPPCRYGARCYNMSEAHCAAFSHPPGAPAPRRPASAHPHGRPASASQPRRPASARPPCKFGAECYNRKPHHRAAYSHPDDDPSTAADNSEEPFPPPFLSSREGNFCPAAAEPPPAKPSDSARWQISSTSAWPRNWTDLAREESSAVEVIFQGCGGKGTHKTRAYSYCFKRWTAVENGASKQRQ